ncbi:MAG TPA: nicotinate phosphoribosyltransferase, partial [Bacillota bacterium]|nr:nicotinate phosphoribosyltransferase [Bacillota bacterium]
MSKFDGRRLATDTFALDVEGLRSGYYSDAYFTNTMKILEALSATGYTFSGHSEMLDIDTSYVQNGDIEVEMQFFPRRQPVTVVAGLDEAIAMLETCTGFFDASGNFVNTYDELEVDAVEDGSLAPFGGDSAVVTPVLRVRGRYRDFAELETPILGVLTEASRIATNVYNTVVAARGKDILFFPARFAHYTVQPLHGYAYALGIGAYNHYHDRQARMFVSTHAQGSYFGARGGGTVSHASVACFLGDTVETMVQFAEVMPPGVPRIALVDFHNDCVRESKAVARALFTRYWDRYKSGDLEGAKRYKLYGVRPDTAGNMRDVSVEPLGDKELDCGVTPRLVWNIRHGLDNAYTEWDDLPVEALEVARQWCSDVKIVVTGGFDTARIAKFESLGVPADIYGVGSGLLDNSRG